MPTVVHFEIPADDVPRARKFYGVLFGWTFEKFPGNGGPDYWIISTGEPDAGTPENMPIGGGMMQRQDPQHSTINYIGVASLDASAGQVTRLGGQIVMPKTPVPKMGWFCVCLDTENNAFGLWENDENAG